MSIAARASVLLPRSSVKESRQKRLPLLCSRGVPERRPADAVSLFAAQGAHALAPVAMLETSSLISDAYRHASPAYCPE